MKLKFSKMHGLGNDFVVLDGVRQQVSLSPEQLAHLADRHFGVGCDQILLVEKAGQAGIDFRYRIFNADGGEVEQCGNGARCFVRFVHDQGLTDKRQIRVETLKGIIEPRLEADGNVTVDMGEPRFLPAEIPFLADDDVIIHLLDVADETLETTVVSMGNPHAVQVVDNVEHAPGRTARTTDRAPPTFPEAGSTPASCRSSTAIPSSCASTSAVRAKPWPVAPVPVRRRSPASGAACSTRRCALSPAAAT